MRSGAESEVQVTPVKDIQWLESVSSDEEEEQLWLGSKKAEGKVNLKRSASFRL